MRTKLSIAIGAAAIALTVSTAAGVASATAGSHQQAARWTAAASVNKHITKAQARQIAKAKVPHSRVIEVESDDLHNRAVWKVTLATSHGRVVVDVDKRTGKATIVRRGSGGGHDDAMAASLFGSDRGSGDIRMVSSASEHREDARDRDDIGDDRGHRHHHENDDDASIR
jgi:uncharacterized membrane protein YkoI